MMSWGDDVVNWFWMVPMTELFWGAIILEMLLVVRAVTGPASRQIPRWRRRGVERALG